jgi:hypothetical protein
LEKIIATHRMRDDDGTVYDVDEIQEYNDASTYDGPGWVEGLKRLELADGSHVNHIDDDTFKIVRTGTVIRRA